MLHTTRAIVLRTIRHGDRTTVLKVYTERAGPRSYLVREGGRSGIKPALLTSLARVELVEDERLERELNYVREVRMEAPSGGTQDANTTALLLFTQEILLRTLKEGSADAALFLFLHNHIGALGAEQDGPMTAIRFLLDLSGHLGFQPSPPEADGMNFDLMEGRFIHGDAPSGYTLRPPLSSALASLLEGSGAPSPLPADLRRDLLDHLLLFYRLHVAGFGEPRSVAVLRQVLA